MRDRLFAVQILVITLEAGGQLSDTFPAESSMTMGRSAALGLALTFAIAGSALVAHVAGHASPRPGPAASSAAKNAAPVRPVVRTAHARASVPDPAIVAKQ